MVVLSLLLCLIALAQKLEPNTNRFGEDLRDFDLPSPDPQACAKACRAEDQCRAFTYLKPNGWPGAGPTGHCWLKSGIPPAKSDSCCISGVVRPEKLDSDETPLPPGKPGEWLLEMTWVGGVAPRVSTLSVSSNGHFRKAKWIQPTPQEGTVPPTALQKLNAAVLAAKISAWKSNYNRPGDDGCCDRIATSLRLRVCCTNGKWVRYSGMWFSLYSPPADLEAVLSAAEF